MDEVYIVIVRGERLYLWRAVEQDGDVLDILVQKRKNKGAAVRFFKKLMKGQERSARKIVTDKLPSYGAARKVVMPTSMHCHDRYANNRAKYHINIREHRSGRCEVSNPPVMHDGSFRFTVKSIIFSVWVGIYLALQTIDF
jgi:transposase-like protein